MKSKEVGVMGVLGMRFGACKLIEKGMKPWGQHGFTATKLQSTKDTIASRMTLLSPRGLLG